MNIATGLAALVLLGAGGTKESGPSDVTVRVSFLDMTGLEWRERFFTELRNVACQGGATVWTADGSVVEGLCDAAATAVEGPKITTPVGATATIVDELGRAYVSSLTRVVDGPSGKATAVGYKPEIGQIRDGCRANLICRPMDQGVLTRLDLDASRMLRLHTVGHTEAVALAKGAAPTPIRSSMQVPEIATCHVKGDWLIPNGGCLVVSLGAHTVAGEDGKAAISERLVILRAEPTSPDAGHAKPGSPAGAALRPARQSVPTDAEVGRAVHTEPRPEAPAPPSILALAITLASPTSDLAAAPRPMPTIPSRSIPQAIATDGRPVALPALPDDAVETASAEGETAEPRPSLQARVAVRRVPEFQVLEMVKLYSGGFCDADATAPVVGPGVVKILEEEPLLEPVAKPEAPKPPAVTRIALGRGVVLELPVRLVTKGAAAPRK